MTHNGPHEFTVPGVPVSWKRPRRSKSGGFFMDPNAQAHQAAIGYYAKQAGVPLLDGPVFLDVRFYWPAKNPPRKREPRPEEWHTTRKRDDLDRLLSAVLDGLSGVAFVDDGQVVSVSAQKVKAAQGEPPRVVVRVGAL